MRAAEGEVLDVVSEGFPSTRVCCRRLAVDEYDWVDDVTTDAPVDDADTDGVYDVVKSLERRESTPAAVVRDVVNNETYNDVCHFDKGVDDHVRDADLCCGNEGVDVLEHRDQGGRVKVEAYETDGEFGRGHPDHVDEGLCDAWVVSADEIEVWHCVPAGLSDGWGGEGHCYRVITEMAAKDRLNIASSYPSSLVRCAQPRDVCEATRRFVVQPRADLVRVLIAELPERVVALYGTPAALGCRGESERSCGRPCR